MNNFNSFTNSQILPFQSKISVIPSSYDPRLARLFTLAQNHQTSSRMTPYDLNSLCVNLQLRQTLQTNLFQMQIGRLLELKSLLLNKFNQQPQLNFKSQLDFAVKTHDDSDDHDSVKLESSLELMKETTSDSSTEQQDVKQEIQKILVYVLENYGRINESVFNNEKAKYQHNKDLLAVFDALTSKYSSTIKTKEEMVKYILRKAFKFVKNNLKKSKNSNKGLVSKTLCDKYFHASEEEISKSGNEELYLKSILPFRKDSKNKTMNSSFIHAIFASDDFSRDYQQYLENFETILEADNQNKLERFAETIIELVKDGKINNISKYKRIPWPKIWIANTLKIAQDLPNLVAQGPNQQFSSGILKKNKLI